MTTTFNPWLLTQLAGGANINGQLIGLALLHQQADIPDTPVPPVGVSALLAQQGFQEIVQTGYRPAPNGVTKSCATSAQTGYTNVVVSGNWDTADPADPPPWLTAPVYVAAGVWYIKGTWQGQVNPWLFVTDGLFNNTMTPGAIIGTPATPKILFQFSVAAGVAQAGLGILYQSPGTAVWESSRTQHVYLFPQRINWIPNPSFEDVGRFGWRANGTITRAPGGYDSIARYFGAINGTLLESVPVPRQPVYRFSCYIRTPGRQDGSGKPGASRANAWCQLGIKGLDGSFNEWAEVYGEQRPLYNTWTRYDEIISSMEDIAAVVPTIKTDGPFDVDMVLLEDTVALHDYFDGDSQTGNPGDFSWQVQQSQSYSFWYNARFITAARLFGGYFNGQVTLPCLLDDWLPSNTAISTHWDVLDETDTKHPLENWGSPTIP